MSIECNENDGGSNSRTFLTQLKVCIVEVKFANDDEPAAIILSSQMREKRGYFSEILDEMGFHLSTDESFKRWLTPRPKREQLWVITLIMLLALKNSFTIRYGTFT